MKVSVIIPVYKVFGQDEKSYVEGNKIRIGFGGAVQTVAFLPADLFDLLD